MRLANNSSFVVCFKEQGFWEALLLKATDCADIDCKGLMLCDNRVSDENAIFIGRV